MKRGAIPIPRLLISLLILAALFFGRETAASSDPAKGGGLRPCRPMSAARAVHTATLLAGGKVLIAGGMERNGVFLDGTELFDPATGAFSPAGRMTHRRTGHTATLLEDGKVLIAGGLEGRRRTAGRWIGDVAVMAELYDPVPGRFAPAGRMATVRTSHAAVRLADGRVLLAGGSDGENSLASAEIYDPVKRTFRPAGAMRTARVPGGAVLLRDGRVLFAGGSGNGGQVLASAEIYDPPSNAFQPAGELATARHKHAAALLPDGRVLIAGGSDERDWRGQLQSAEIYDPASRRFRQAGRMASPRFKHGAAVVPLSDGRILFAGGASSPEIYEPEGGAFRSLRGNLGEPRYFATATRLANGRVLIAGGYGTGRAGSGPLSTAEAWLFRPE
jgi:hypothetical protein